VKPLDWNSMSLPGKTLVLVHPTEVRIYPFRSDFTTVATLGNDGPSGPIAGPILFWRIYQNRLFILKVPPDETEDLNSLARNEAEEVLSRPTANGDLVNVTRMSGEQATFRLVKP